MKAVLRRRIINSLNKGGLFSRLARSRWRNERLLILCYHGISLDNEHLWDPRMYFSTEAFRSRLALLRKWQCNVLPLEEGLTRLRSGQLPPRAVVLTFDDGSCDFYHRALPVLREFGFPATVYLTTYYSGKPVPVFPMGCSYVAWCAAPRVVDIETLIRGLATIDLGVEHDRNRLVRLLVEHVDREGLSGDGKADFLERLAALLGVDFDPIRRRRILQIMNRDEVAAVSAAGMAVELHTHRHRTPDNRDLFIREIRDNRAAIVSMTGKVPVHFCYPSGLYKPAFVPWLRGEGVVSATTCVPGLASRRSDPVVLPRFVDRSPVSSEEFEAWLTGAATIFPSLRRLLAPRSIFGEA